MVNSSDHMRDHKCDYDDKRYSEQPKNDWHAICPGRPVFLFFEGGAMNFIEKSAITTNEYWLRVYRSCPNFAQ